MKAARSTVARRIHVALPSIGPCAQSPRAFRWRHPAHPCSHANSHQEPTMDAITFLTNDHKVVRAMLEELAATTKRAVKRRTELLQKIAAELEAHTQIEEEIFYPAFKEAGEKSDDDKMFFEAMEEHRTAGDLVLPDLLQTEVGSDQFSGRAKVLKELIDHHAKEEEKEMFPRARKLLGKAELNELGERLAARKAELI
jgi:hemerythrin superfamily protein